LYVPLVRPEILIEVAVFAEVMDAEFQDASAALVMLARFETVTDVFTKYAVPTSVL
jgi:hypothetical protein